jgi:2-methylcitrate dehydratase PrpD
MHEPNITEIVAQRAARLRYQDLTPAALTVAKQCLLDWLGVTIAGSEEPLVRILLEERLDAGLGGAATVVGRSERLALPAAVLVNGAMSHALDYDDVHKAMRGHPSVPVMPVALGLGAHLHKSGRDALAAFVTGFETECRVGALCAHSHYARGFHPTATIGTFGAAAAAGWLLGLGPSQMTLALGAAGTQAAGLKSAFGTHCKPLHAGRAAEAGLLAARLAARGFTAAADILGDEQGFAKTQSDGFDWAAAQADPEGGFHITRTLFKYHAACFLTHSSIEALKSLRPLFALRPSQALTPADVQAVTLHVVPGHLKICGIEAPQSGLEVKFSLRMTAAMALAGVDTASECSYTDALAHRPDLVALRDKVRVVTDWKGEASAAQVVVTLAGGQQHTAQFDVGVPMQDLAQQGAMLETKFRSLMGSRLGPQRTDQLIAACRDAEHLPDIGALLALTLPMA